VRPGVGGQGGKAWPQFPCYWVYMSTQHVAGRRETLSPWTPFRHRAFLVVWTATVVANVGTWIYNAAAAWLMTTLKPDPLTVSLVQVANNLPIVLLALPAGALADIIDKRKFLIFAESASTLVAAVFAVMVWLHLVTPASLLLFLFLIGVVSAIGAPAWQSVVTQLVPKADLAPAIAANSAGFNVSRAVGPALGGILVGAYGVVVPFWVNAISNLATVGALVWWRSPARAARRLPAEQFASAIRVGIRHARSNLHLRASLVRAVAFYLFASAYWALLPLVARERIAAGPGFYGVLLGMIGASAIAGAFALPSLKARVGANGVVAGGTIVTAIALVLFGLARAPLVALAASILAGASWIAVVAALNVSAQVALPEWVRARGLAIFVTAFFGALTLGSALWGEVAALAGLPAAHFIAAAGILLAIPATWRWKLHSGAGLDLTPSMHWPAPVVVGQIAHDRGPVLVTVEYRVLPERRKEFLAAIKTLGRERRRDGAYRWGVFADSADHDRYLETFLMESWVEHLRQHERVTNSDRVLQERIRHMLHGPLTVTHFIAADFERS